MYLPQHFEETRLDVLHDFIDAHPFAAIIAQTTEGLHANHIPFELDRSGGHHGVLRAHIARANPLWKLYADGTEALTIFQGPHAYITPSWYPTKQTTGKAVPTWAYATTHVYGTLQFVHEPEWLLGLVDRLSQKNEAGRDAPWAVSDAPGDYIDRLLGAIVGIEIRIQRIDGKWKLDQNKQVDDRLGAVDGLRRENALHSKTIAQLISNTLD